MKLEFSVTCLMTQMTSLKTLVLQECSFSYDSFRGISSLSQLEKLVVTNCPMKIFGIPPGISQLVHLKYLDLSNNPTLHGDDLEHLTTLTELETLCLADTDLEPASVSCLSSLTNLQYLDIQNTWTNDDALRNLSTLTKLRILNIDWCVDVKDGGTLSVFSKLENLSCRWYDIFFIPFIVAALDWTFDNSFPMKNLLAKNGLKGFKLLQSSLRIFFITLKMKCLTLNAHRIKQY